jgi:hypothetical protein
MSELNIEKAWVTQAGLPAKVLIMPMGHRCGYVGVDAKTFEGKGYDDINVDVHGGLTYARTEEDGLLWYGYDCAHLGDARDVNLMDAEHKEIYEKYHLDFNDAGDTVKSLDYCINECENLATQLKQLEETV